MINCLREGFAACIRSGTGSAIWEEKKMQVLRNKGKRLNRYVPDYIVFDLETTGISIQRDTIIEISALKVEQGRITGEYSTLVNPRRHIPAGASAVNGITDAMVANAPELKEAMEEFLAFIGQGVLVGHNIHTFDTNFIYDAVLSLFGKELRNDYVDTLYMARQCLPQLTHHTLGDVSAYFHISTAGAHRALNDCRMNQQIYEQMGKMLRENQSRTQEGIVCPLCGSRLVRRKGRYGEFYGCSSYPGCRYTQKV